MYGKKKTKLTEDFLKSWQVFCLFLSKSELRKLFCTSLVHHFKWLFKMKIIMQYLNNIIRMQWILNKYKLYIIWSAEYTLAQVFLDDINWCYCMRIKELTSNCTWYEPVPVMTEAIKWEVKLGMYCLAPSCLNYIYIWLSKDLGRCLNLTIFCLQIFFYLN